MVEKTPKVSVLMNCYNSAEFLKEAIDSVYAQTMQDFEVLFIDNQSTDNSAQIAQSYDERLRYIKTPEFLTLYGGRNFGLSHARGEFFTVLDCDDFWKPNKLELQIKEMEQANADFSYTGFKIKLEGTPPLKFLLFTVFQFFRSLIWTHSSPRFVDFESIVKNYPINLQTIMIRRSKIGDLNFNPKLSLIGDMDFFYRLFKSKAITPLFIPQITTVTRRHSKQLSRASVRNWLKETRYVYFFFFRELFNEHEKKLYKHTIDMYRFQLFAAKGLKSKAIKTLEPYKNYDFMHLYYYLKLKLLS